MLLFYILYIPWEFDRTSSPHPCSFLLLFFIYFRVSELLITFEDRHGCIYELSKKSDASTTVQSVDITSKNEILAGGFLSDAMDSVMLCAGSASKPKFRRLVFIATVEGEGQGQMRQFLEGPLSLSKTLNPSVENDGHRREHENFTVQNATILGPEQMGALKRPLVGVAAGDGVVEEPTSKRLSMAMDVAASTMTMEERLESISSSLSILEENGTE